MEAKDAGAKVSPCSRQSMLRTKQPRVFPGKKPSRDRVGGSKHIVSPDAGGAVEGRRGERSRDRLSSQGRALKEARAFP